MRTISDGYLAKLAQRHSDKDGNASPQQLMAAMREALKVQALFDRLDLERELEDRIAHHQGGGDVPAATHPRYRIERVAR